MSLFISLRTRAFALLWTGQTISRLGDSLYRIALSWWVLEKTGSATAMGTVLVVSSLPMLLFLLIGGVVVDRLPRFRVLFASDVLNGCVVAVVSVLAATRALEIWHVYVAGAIFGLSDAFFYPAYSASVPQIVPPESLPSANSLTGLSFQITGIVGPAVGATLVALGGTPAAFGLDSLSFFISAAFLAPLIRIALPRTSAQAAPGPVRDLRDGLAEVGSRTWLWLSIAFFGLINIFDAGPRNVALPFLVHDHLGLEVGALGAVTSAIAVGSVAAAIFLGRYPRLPPRSPALRERDRHGPDARPVRVDALPARLDSGRVHLRRGNLHRKPGMDEYAAGNGAPGTTGARVEHRRARLFRLPPGGLRFRRDSGRPNRLGECVPARWCGGGAPGRGDAVRACYPAPRLTLLSGEFFAIRQLD